MTTITRDKKLTVRLVKDKTMYVIRWEQGGPVPEFLDGYYTDVPTAQSKIDLYMQGVGCKDVRTRKGKWAKDQARKAQETPEGKVKETVLNG